ncbi:MAG: hypothetical protein GY714_04385 [Desulfobacterales bacterium]|nr:hypothetical protein [Desulfobacterales bacterium]
MKKTILIFVVFSTFLYNYSFSYENTPFSLYKSNYFVTAGESDSDEGDTQSKGQFSVKYKIMEPWQSQIYFGYTGTFWWQIYEKSKPVMEHNYAADLFYKRDSFLRYDSFDFYQMGIAHISNGEDGEKSRGINYVYGQTQVSYGDDINVGGGITVRNYFGLPNTNIDYEEYCGIFDFTFFAKFNEEGSIIEDGKILYQYTPGGTFNTDRGKHILTLEFKLLREYFNTLLYIRYENGYGINGLIDYDRKSSAIMIGLKI